MERQPRSYSASDIKRIMEASEKRVSDYFWENREVLRERKREINKAIERSEERVRGFKMKGVI